MKIKNAIAALSLSFLSLPALSLAADAEKVVDTDKNTEMQISIYNNNLAFVRDTRNIDLQRGENKVAFVGVSSQIRPETAMLFGKGIEVMEQNYNYNLLNPSNLLEASVGKTVKTALYNEQTGKTVYDTAVVLEAGYGKPVLKFSYGIETDFPGRVIYENVPDGLRTKPTLVVDMKNKSVAGAQNVELAYLTSGLSWKADYVADLQADNTLTLNGWITLKNDSGVDYNNATVQLIAGSVNQVSSNVIRPLMMARSFKAMGAVAESAAMDSAVPTSEAFADYYLYNLPAKTSIKDKQTKQVSLMVKNKVKYAKEYKLNSPLYLSYNSGENDFTKANPQVVYKLNNVKEDGLGEALPQGTIRFFENDSKKNLQFIGEANLPQLASGEKTELNLGQAFDIFASGKISSAKKISEKVTEASVEITFNNAKDEAVEVEFTQNYGGTWKVNAESVKSEKKNAYASKWLVKIPAHGKKVLTYTVLLTKKD